MEQLEGGKIAVTLDELSQLLDRRLAEKHAQAKVINHLKVPINKNRERIPYRELNEKGELVPATYAHQEFPRMVYHESIPLDKPQRTVHSKEELAAALKEGYSLEPVSESEEARARRKLAEADRLREEALATLGGDKAAAKGPKKGSKTQEEG